MTSISHVKPQRLMQTSVKTSALPCFIPAGGAWWYGDRSWEKISHILILTPSPKCYSLVVWPSYPRDFPQRFGWACSVVWLVCSAPRTYSYYARTIDLFFHSQTFLCTNEIPISLALTIVSIFCCRWFGLRNMFKASGWTLTSQSRIQSNSSHQIEIMLLACLWRWHWRLHADTICHCRFDNRSSIWWHLHKIPHLMG